METPQRMARPPHQEARVNYEYTTFWWTGSTTHLKNAIPAVTTPPITENVQSRVNLLGSEGWELIGITAAPLTTGWLSPAGRPGIAGFTDKVHYIATFKRPARQ